MQLTITPELLPLSFDADDVVRVGKTRVTLDTVITVFKGGARPEEIIECYPVLTLAQVYAVIAYYLNNETEVEAYLCQRQQEAGQIYANFTKKFPQSDLKEKLLAHQAKKS
ncbi:DUF433 domain-containing protein [Thermosynechococcaceae cyanobacterium BACA0444]|uniref:DUF433 domain-containing protein n=1 Tax=Pseudocalidococcus azoricus BACA0444 TaxID=2918990 RepID=A0AAE4JYR0_9CYAN|nr:DUF433 domain-containing protein [Pseudocalidococcus azoricus]MDS3860007.1 DUF433 domain-containing protein [Pseudocalidococcus azoricus BACA0444]